MKRIPPLSVSHLNEMKKWLYSHQSTFVAFYSPETSSEDKFMLRWMMREMWAWFVVFLLVVSSVNMSFDVSLPPVFLWRNQSFFLEGTRRKFLRNRQLRRRLIAVLRLIPADWVSSLKQHLNCLYCVDFIEYSTWIKLSCIEFHYELEFFEVFALSEFLQIIKSTRQKEVSSSN